MDTPQCKVSYGRGVGRLVSTTPGPVVSAPGPLVASPGPLAAGSDSVFNNANWINAIPVKLPKLWQSKVRSWFAQAEAQLSPTASQRP